MNITIKDIAKLAGVSHTTVSRALNDSELIKTSTKEKIKKIAMEKGYTPNVSARSLVLDRSYNIGLFFSTLSEGTSSSFFHEVVRGVSLVIKNEYNLIVKGIDQYNDFFAITKKSFDGIIIMSQSPKDEAFIEDISNKKIPMILLNRESKKDVSSWVLSDDRMGSQKATQYLIDMGHKDIAIIEGIEGFQSSVERKEGYIRAMKDNDIEIDPDFMVKGEYNLQSGYTAMIEILNLKKRPTAVFCSNDDMAVGAMKAIISKGLSIPEDISIVGFDDNIFSEYTNPGLTTVRRPVGLIGQIGARYLIDVLDNSREESLKMNIKTELIVRDSVKKPKN